HQCHGSYRDRDGHRHFAGAVRVRKTRRFAGGQGHGPIFGHRYPAEVQRETVGGRDPAAGGTVRRNSSGWKRMNVTVFILAFVSSVGSYVLLSAWLDRRARAAAVR